MMTTLLPRRWRMALAAVLGCGAMAVRGQDVAARPSIYAGPDLVVLYPVEGTAIFVSAVLAASLVEFAIARLMAIENEYFQLVYKSVAEETIVCSILTLMIIFAKSVGGLQPKWVLMLNYAVMSLLFMVMFFVVITGSCVIVLHIEMRNWRNFEGTRIDVDPKLSSRQMLFKQCRDRFRESVVGKDIKYFPQMQFNDYMKRMERFTVAEITDLSWKSWIALVVVVVINGVRSRITTGTQSETTELSTTDRTVNVGSYIGFVGYTTLLVYVVLHLMLQYRLRHFASSPAATVDANTGRIELVSSASLLYFGSFRTTAHIFQCTILILEWYLAVFVLGMGYEVWDTYGFASIGVFAGAVLPLAVFIYMFPWTITMVTMLQGLGADLNVEEAQKVSDAAAAEEDAKGAVTRDTAALGPDGSGAGHHTAHEKDEWNGERLTLHETSANRLVDIYVPNLHVRADRPNRAPTRKQFDPRPLRSALAANSSGTGGPRDRSFYQEGLDLPPPPAGTSPPRRPINGADGSALPVNRWIDADVTRAERPAVAGAARTLRDPLAVLSDDDEPRRTTRARMDEL